MILVSLHLTQEIMNTIDDLVKAGVYPSRSEAIRSLILLGLNALGNKRKKIEDEEVPFELLKGR